MNTRMSSSRQRSPPILIGLTVQLLASYTWIALVTAQLQVVTIRRPDPISNNNQYISFTIPTGNFNLGSNSNANPNSNINSNANANVNSNSNANANANTNVNANANTNANTNANINTYNGVGTNNAGGAAGNGNGQGNSSNNGGGAPSASPTGTSTGVNPGGSFVGNLGASQVSRFTAKPGSVIVHFDRSHEIQRLQYVLQDGRLATLYQRANTNAPGAQSNGRSPSSSSSSSSSSSMPTLQRRGDLNDRAVPRDQLRSQLRIDDDQTIEILDDKMIGVGQLVGDHVTFELPVESELGATKVIQQQPMQQHQQQQQQHQQPFKQQQQLYGSGLPSKLPNDRMEVLATIAADAIQSGALQAGEAKLRKAGVFVDKLKGKLTQKLLELPDIIEAKLRAKSSAGQMFVDQAGNQVMVLGEGKGNGNGGAATKGAGGGQMSTAGGYPTQQTLPILLRSGASVH